MWWPLPVRVRTKLSNAYQAKLTLQKDGVLKLRNDLNFFTFTLAYCKLSVFIFDIFILGILRTFTYLALKVHVQGPAYVFS
jgi:hypothetical protein